MATEIQQLAKVVEGPAKNLKIDLPAKAGEVKMLVTKDGAMSDAASCISSVDATSSTKENEAEQESVVSDQSMYYPVNGVYGYYYPEWDGQNYYGADSLESQRPVSQPDNGSVIYYFPGFQPDYTSYNSYLPGATVNVDGQYLAQPLYYPSSPFSPTFLSPGLYPQSVAYGPEMVPAYSWDSYPIYTDGFYGNMDGDSTYSAPKPNFSSHTLSKTYPPKSDIADKKGSSITVDVSRNPTSQSHHLKPSNKASVLSKGILPAKKLPQYDAYPIQGKLYPYNNTSIKESGRTWAGTEKPKARNKVHGYGDFDMQNEQNRGPRTTGGKSNFVSDPVGSFGIEGNGTGNGASNLVVRKEEYNLVDFPIKYEHALFFVIKSYSEDDIHKSIKYNVWASTPNGNKRLDNAFQLAQEKMAEKGIKCPIFLFFSVNASGQFCGVAEMTGRVDFCKTMDFWQQDKWTGYFPVKWHIIKDVPNPQFRHVILENNENKPVTNSRDTQEVKFVQGTEILNIFKNYSSKTSILDDFGFYENRQKAMQQDRRIKDPTPNVELLSLKAGDKVEVQATDQNAIVSGIASIEIAAAEAKEELPTGDDEAKE